MQSVQRENFELVLLWQVKQEAAVSRPSVFSRIEIILMLES